MVEAEIVAPAAPRGATRWRLLGAIVVAAGVAWFLVAHRSEIPAAWDAVSHARWPWLLLALATVALWLANLALFHGAAQRSVGLDPEPTLALATTAANFLNLVTKSGGMGGLAALLADGRRREARTPTIVAAYLAVVVIGEWGFTATLALSLVIMWQGGVLHAAEVVAAAVFAVLVLAKVVAVVAALRSADAVRRLYALPHKLAHRLLRRPTPSDTRAADEFADAIAFVRTHRRAVPSLAAHSIAVELIGALQLWAVLHALGRGTPSEALVTYCVGVLFAIVGFLPGGLGFVEASMAATLISYGIDAPVAAAATVLYRVCELWLPVLIGGIAWVWLSRTASRA